MLNRQLPCIPLSEQPQNRRADRRRQLKAAIIAFNDRHSTLPCSLRDISDKGARLDVDATKVPDTFELIVELDGLEARCEVVWRRKTVVGVRFLEPPTHTKPRRTQVVQVLAPSATPSLRRKPISPGPR